ncbi:MAG TPA: DNA polymerase III subunit alpha, partial [Limnochorda sp.]
EQELEVIGKLDVADAFLVAWDLVRFAQERGIRHAGRGSAADSAVAYCLGLTDVDSIGRGLLFERFLSLERAQKPDIDLDFEAERRDEVAAYVYRRYGKDHVASVCTFQTYHARSALRDLGKVLGFPEEEIGPLAKRFPHIPADQIPQALEALPELRESGLPFERYRLLFELASQVAGFPRHIGTHLGGLVLSREPLSRVAPLEQAAKGVTILSFDKDDVEALGLIKLDLLSLRTLSAVETATRAIQVREPSFRYEAIPLDDRPTFEMLGRGETVGAFQLESPAQRALQARLGAESIEDVVASVALIRPGPIKGDMVEPFLRRRRGLEPVTYVDPRLAPILEKTYGVVLYQEQVIQIATVIGGFTPGEADQLRRVMTHYRSHEEMERIGRHFIEKAVARGTSREVAEVIFSYIVGYAGYGFCEAHAAAFADTAYKTAYLLRHYPAEFYAALLSHQPMGFYPPNTLVHEARRRGIQVLPPDINRSEKHCTVEEGKIRLSLRLVRELREADVDEILAERARRPFTSLQDLCRRTHLTREGLTYLILAGALDAFDHNRRRLLFSLEEALRQREEPLAPAASGGGPAQQRLELVRPGPPPEVEDFSPDQRLLLEYEALGVTTERHLLALLEPELREMGVTPSKQLRQMEAGQPVRVAGLLIRPHRPPTRSGRTVVFLTLEDPYGMVDATVFEPIYQRDGEAIFGGYPVLVVDGRVAWRGKGVSVDATRVRAFTQARKRTPAAQG